MYYLRISVLFCLSINVAFITVTLLFENNVYYNCVGMVKVLTYKLQFIFIEFHFDEEISVTCEDVLLTHVLRLNYLLR